MPKRSVDAFRPTGLEIGRRFYSETDIDSIIEDAGGLPDGDIEHKRANASGTELFSTVLVSRREALTERLHRAAQARHSNRQWQTAPTPQNLTDAFKEVEKTAARLLVALHLPRRPELEDALGMMPTALRFGGLEAQAALEARAAVKEQAAFEAARTSYVPGEGLDITGADLLRTAIRGVYQLQDWSRAAKETSGAEPATPREERRSGDPPLDEFYKSLGAIWEEVFDRPIKTSLTFAGEGKQRVGGPMVRFFDACLKPLLGEESPTHEAIDTRNRRLFPDRGESTPKKG